MTLLSRSENPVSHPLRRRLTQDWSANTGRPDSQALLVAFRTAQWALERGRQPGYIVARAAYWGTYFAFGCEFPPTAAIGPGLRLFHPHGIVINPGAQIGAGCTLRQNVTIGNRSDRDGVPGPSARIHDRVEMGAACVVIGDVDIGSGARLGAGAVVVRSVPAGATAVGNPVQIREYVPRGGREPAAPRL